MTTRGPDQASGILAHVTWLPKNVVRTINKHFVHESGTGMLNSHYADMAPPTLASQHAVVDNFSCVLGQISDNTKHTKTREIFFPLWRNGVRIKIQKTNRWTQQDRSLLSFTHPSNVMNLTPSSVEKSYHVFFTRYLKWSSRAPPPAPLNQLH